MSWCTVRRQWKPVHFSVERRTRLSRIIIVLIIIIELGQLHGDRLMVKTKLVRTPTRGNGATLKRTEARPLHFTVHTATGKLRDFTRAAQKNSRKGRSVRE